MKKSKILIPALSIASVGAVVTPILTMTSCNKGNSDGKIGSEITEAEAKTKYTAAYAKYLNAYTKVSVSGTAEWSDGTKSSLTEATLSYATLPIFYTETKLCIVVSKHSKGSYDDYTAGVPFDGDSSFTIKKILDAAKTAAGTGAELKYYATGNSIQGIIKDSTGKICFNVIVNEYGHITRRYSTNKIQMSTALSFPPADITYTYSK